MIPIILRTLSLLKFGPAAKAVGHFQLGLIVYKVLSSLPYLRLIFFTIPSVLFLTFFVTGVKKYFVAVRAFIPQQFGYVFYEYARAFYTKFGPNAIGVFQNFVKVIRSVVNSMIVFLFFYSFNYFEKFVKFLFSPMDHFFMYYKNLEPKFLEILPLFHIDILTRNSRAVYHICAFLTFFLMLALTLRFIYVIFSIANQLRLLFMSFADNVTVRIIELIALNIRKDANKVPVSGSKVQTATSAEQIKHADKSESQPSFSLNAKEFLGMSERQKRAYLDNLTKEIKKRTK